MTDNQQKRHVIVAGSGRSGTTWIGDTIAACQACCPVFEPLRAKRVPGVPQWGRESGLPGPYLRPGDEHPGWKNFFRGLFAGQISSVWTRQDWTRVPAVLSRRRLTERVAYRLAKWRYRAREVVSERYVVKEIRGNLMLVWLDEHFPVEIVFVTRHPCAVIGSRLRLGWTASLTEILIQSDLMEDYLEPYRELIAAADSPLQRQAVLWCVENFLPLSQAKGRDWLVCSYEECVLNPQETFDRIFHRLGLERTSAAERAQNQMVSNPDRSRRTETWHSPLSEVEGEEVLRICEGFGLGLNPCGTWSADAKRRRMGDVGLSNVRS